jgi:hypothetical protein
VYNDITENWYYHSIEDDNLIDIETLIIEVLIDFLYRHDNRHQ